MQNIAKKKQIEKSSRAVTPSTSRQTPGSSSVSTLSPEVDLRIPESPKSQQTPSLTVPRTPGSLVSNLIYKFENSSLSPSPFPPASESKKSNIVKETGSEERNNDQVEDRNKPSSDYNYLRDSKILSRSKLILRDSADEKLDNNSNLISNEDDNEGITDGASDNMSECLTGSLPQSCNASDVLDSGFEQDTGYSVVMGGTQPIYDSEKDTLGKDNEDELSTEQAEDRGILLSGGLDTDDTESEKDEEVGTPLRRKLLWKVNTPSKDGDSQLEMCLDIETESFMKQSHLMKLTHEVQEHEALLKEVKRKVSLFLSLSKFSPS